MFGKKLVLERRKTAGCAMIQTFPIRSVVTDTLRFDVQILIFSLVPVPVFAATRSDEERLERLERAVELLQQRNAELEAEVKSLKKPAAPKSPAPLAEEKRSHFAPDNKTVEKSETIEE